MQQNQRTQEILAPPPIPPEEVRKIYNNRCKHDLLYAILTTKAPAKLDPHVAGIKKLLEDRNVNITPSLKQAFELTLNNSSPTAKHAIILFALHAENAFKQYFTQRSNNRVIGEFCMNVLPQLVHALLTGHYLTLNDFVADARNNYTII